MEGALGRAKGFGENVKGQLEQAKGDANRELKGHTSQQYLMYAGAAATVRCRVCEAHPTPRALGGRPRRGRALETGAATRLGTVQTRWRSAVRSRLTRAARRRWVR